MQIQSVIKRYGKFFQNGSIVEVPEGTWALVVTRGYHGHVPSKYEISYLTPDQDEYIVSRTQVFSTIIEEDAYVDDGGDDMSLVSEERRFILWSSEPFALLQKELQPHNVGSQKLFLPQCVDSGVLSQHRPDLRDFLGLLNTEYAGAPTGKLRLLGFLMSKAQPPVELSL